MSQPLLKVENLKLHYPIHGGLLFRKIADVKAVDGVSFELLAGKTLGLVGESGCGKSSLGRAIMQLDKPTSGSIKFHNEELIGKSRKELFKVRRQVQMIFQDPMQSLDPRQSVREILREPYIIHSLGKHSEQLSWIEDILDKVGLPKNSLNRYPHEFSGGQRQRICIARALTLKPQLLICDEVVSALDVSIQAQILNLLLELQRELKLSMLFIAHDLAVVKHISDDIAVMYLGKIQEHAPSHQIYQKPKHPYTQALTQAIPSFPKPGEKILQNAFLSEALHGEAPSPRNPPPGCAFHPRCPKATEICQTTAPQSKETQGTKVACHHT